MKLQDNNPKTRAGNLKTPLRLVPTLPIELEAQVMKLGADKYGAYNWRDETVSSTVYYEAAMRHLFAWFNGEDKDPESGQSHLAHVRACMGILIDADAHKKLNDDRPSSEQWVLHGDHKFVGVRVETDQTIEYYENLETGQVIQVPENAKVRFEPLP